MKFIKIENYNCENCGCKEYDVIDLDIPLIICSDCGTVYNGEYEAIDENEEV